MTDSRAAAAALKHSFDTGDRSEWEALFAPGCVNWHNSDKQVVPAVGFNGAAALATIVDDLRADILQTESFPGGLLIRFAIRGTVIASGRELEAHNCLIVTDGDAGITRIDDYVDPTLIEQLTTEAP